MKNVLSAILGMGFLFAGGCGGGKSEPAEVVVRGIAVSDWETGTPIQSSEPYLLYNDYGPYTNGPEAPARPNIAQGSDGRFVFRVKPGPRNNYYLFTKAMIDQGSCRSFFSDIIIGNSNSAQTRYFSWGASDTEGFTATQNRALELAQQYNVDVVVGPSIMEPDACTE